MVGWLKKKFDHPKDAEIYYSRSDMPTHHHDTGVQTDLCLIDQNADIDQLPSSMTLEVMSTLFSCRCERELGLLVPVDFLTLAASAMLRLSRCGRSNVLYSLAKGIGTMRDDESDSYFPVQRMPMGLVEYVANFFVSENVKKVCVFDLYAQLYMYIPVHTGPPLPK